MTIKPRVILIFAVLFTPVLSGQGVWLLSAQEPVLTKEEAVEATEDAEEAAEEAAEAAAEAAQEAPPKQRSRQRKRRRTPPRQRSGPRRKLSNRGKKPR